MDLFWKFKKNFGSSLALRATQIPTWRRGRRNILAENI